RRHLDASRNRLSLVERPRRRSVPLGLHLHAGRVRELLRRARGGGEGARPSPDAGRSRRARDAALEEIWPRGVGLKPSGLVSAYRRSSRTIRAVTTRSAVPTSQPPPPLMPPTPTTTPPPHLRPW